MRHLKVLFLTAFTTTQFLFLTTSVEAQFAQQGGKLVGSGAVGTAWQGISVALSADGNTAMVGGHVDNYFAGAVWAWTRSNGVWTQQGNKLVGSGASGDARQGRSVSLSSDGNTAIVGGYNDDSGGNPNNGGSDYGIGAAWIWTRSGGVWTQQGSKLVGSGAVGNTDQGQSVSISSDGNTAIVGGYGDNGNVGAAWVWTRSNGVWTQQGSKLVGSGSVGTPVYQGNWVSLSGDGNTAIVGGFGDNGFIGAAWVWTRSNGVWTQQGSKLVGTGAIGAPQQGFSVSLSFDGNTAIVGGRSDDSAGAAWVWTRSGGVWTQQGNKLFGTGAVGSVGSGDYGDQGRSVSLDSAGNTAIIGSENDNSDTGAVWVWTRSGGVWTQQGKKLVGTGTGPYPNPPEQGYSIALSSDGNTVIEGAFGDNGDVGAAWVFTKPAPAIVYIPNSVTDSTNKATIHTPTSTGGPITSCISTHSLPAGLTISNSCVISGTPTTASAAILDTVIATGLGGVATATITITVVTGIVQTPPATCVTLTPPQNATVYSVTANLTWAASTGATSYHVQISTNSGFTPTVLDDSILTTTSLNYSYPNLGIYYWRVRAKNVGGTSAWSATLNFTVATVGILPQQFTFQRLNIENGEFLRFELPQQAHVVIQLFNTQGQMISKLLDETRNAGYYTMPLSVGLRGSYDLLDFKAGDFHRTISINN